jgi:hypothetical protein
MNKGNIMEVIMRFVSKNVLAWGLIALLPFVGISCLEREEEITVAEDGTVTIVASFDGNASDFAPPVVLPSEPDWEIIEQGTDTTKEGQVRIKLEAQKTIPYKQHLPSSYISTDKPNYDINLQFPTEINIVHEDNRTIYEFKRTYAARDYASFNLSTSPWWDQELEDSVIENGIFNVSEQERNDYLEQFSVAFACYHWRFVDMTLGELALAGKISPATYSKIDKHVWNYLQDQVTPVRMLGILGKDEDDIDDALEGLQEEVRQNILTIVASYEPYFDTTWESVGRLQKKPDAEEFDEKEAKDHVRNIVDAAVEQIVREAMPIDSILSMTVFSTMFDQLSQRYKLTERIGADNFAVRLHMPGTILVTNGFKDPDEPSYIDWNFKGDDLRDRSTTLYAISVVDK